MIRRPNSTDVARAMAQLDRRNQPPPPSVMKVRAMTAGGNLARVLGGGGPGTWASDHRKEVEAYAGWHYIAISAIVRQFQQAEPYAYDNEELKRLRLEAEEAEYKPFVEEPPMGGAPPFGQPPDEGEEGEDKPFPPKKKFPSQFKSVVNATQARGTPLDDEHPLTKLITHPNPYQAGNSFRGEIALQMRLTGKALIWNVPNALNIPVERYVIPTALAQPQMPTVDYPNGGWKITPEGGRYGQEGWFLTGPLSQMIGYVISADQVQEIREIHPLHKDDSQSPIGAGALWTDTSNMVDRARHSHLATGPNPSVAVTMPDGWNADETELARAQQKFNELYGGPDKHGKAIFTVGGQVALLDTNPKDMAYDVGFMQLRDALMALHGVPPLAAGIQQATGREGLYAPLIQFIMLTVQPMLDVLAEEDTRVIGKYWNAKIEYRAKQINDPDQLEQELQTDLAAGTLTVDELRVLRGRKPWGGKEGGAIAGKPPAPPNPFGGPPMEGAPGEGNPFDKIKGKQPDFLDSGKNGDAPKPGGAKPPFGGKPGFGGIRKSLFEYLHGSTTNGNGHHHE